MERGVRQVIESAGDKPSRPSGGGNARPLTIALGIHRLSPRGGLEDNCIRIGEELTRRGHKVSFFVAGALPKHANAVTSLAPRFTLPFNHSRAAHFAKAFIAATSNRFDRTVAFQPIPGADILFTADWVRKRKDVPEWRMTPRLRTYRALEAGCFGPSSKTRILALSEPQISAYIDAYGTSRERIAILPPTLAAVKRRPEHRTEAVRQKMRAELGLDPSAPVWLWLGLQPAVKGLDRVLKALEHHPETHLLVIGVDGADHKARAVVAQAKKANISDRIHWLGYIPEPRLLDCVAAADVLAHPARLDITGGVILESIVNGLPVVATSICGFATHILDSGAGKVIQEPFDGDAFSSSLADVCGRQNAVYSANGIAYGDNPILYSGTEVACDLIEDWPISE